VSALSVLQENKSLPLVRRGGAGALSRGFSRRPKRLEMQTGRDTISPACGSRRRSTRLSVINIVNWGVWLGRHICKTITQVFQDKLRKNRNLSSTIKRKACLILIFSTNTNHESVIQRSFKLCKETLTNLYLEVSEKLPKG